LAAFYILSSIQHMTGLTRFSTDLEYYKTTLPDNYSDFFVIARLSFSWFQRFLGLAGAVGILFLKDIFRKLMLIISYFTIAVVFWKHPYSAFLSASEFALKEYPHYFSSANVTAPLIAKVSVILFIALEILFCSVVIFYLTRPKVKAQFR